MARELPIFPLPIVLFPGAPQPLHIFEPRYRQLLVDCQDGDRRFGIAYVAPDRAPAADPAPSAGDVGCVALIRSIQPLPDGRSNILAVGERRFVLRRWVEREPPRPYQVAEVEEFDDEPVEPAEAAALAADVLSFQVAAALELDAAAKRALQASRSTTLRLRQLAAVLGPLATDAERRAAVRRRAKGNGRGGRHPQIEHTT